MVVKGICGAAGRVGRGSRGKPDPEGSHVSGPGMGGHRGHWATATVLFALGVPFVLCEFHFMCPGPNRSPVVVARAGRRNSTVAYFFPPLISFFRFDAARFFSAPRKSENTRLTSEQRVSEILPRLFISLRIYCSFFLLSPLQAPSYRLFFFIFFILPS